MQWMSAVNEEHDGRRAGDDGRSTEVAFSGEKRNGPMAGTGARMAGNADGKTERREKRLALQTDAGLQCR